MVQNMCNVSAEALPYAAYTYLLATTSKTVAGMSSSAH